MNSLDTQYIQLLRTIMDNGYVKTGRNGTTKSIFGYEIVHNMQDGFPLLTTKKMAWKQIVTELIWFLRGDTKLRPLVENGNWIWLGDAYNHYKKNVPHQSPDFLSTQKEFGEAIMKNDEFAETWGDLGPIYGWQWRNWGSEIPFGEATSSGDVGIDQIKNLIHQLRTNPDSRRMLVSAWNVNDLDEMTLPPCHYGFQVYTRELSMGEKEKWCKENDNHMDCPNRAISLKWNQRSVDTFLGLPFNIASYGLLLEIIAAEVNMIPEHLIGSLGDAHIYEEHYSAVKEQMNNTGYDLPTVTLSKDWQVKSSSPLFADTIESSDIVLNNYKSNPRIKAPLIN